MDYQKPHRIQIGKVTIKLSEKNKNSLDWSWSNLVAYGSQNAVIVMEPKEMRVIQTLHHEANVTKVKWGHDNFHHSAGSPYSLRLVSETVGGHLSSWDAGEGTLIAKFNEPGKSVSDMCWLGFDDTSRDLLLVLHSTNCLILWNTVTGIPLWKKPYYSPARLTQLSFDPFNHHRIAVLGGNCLMLIDNFQISECPNGDGEWLSLQKQGTKESNGKTPCSGSIKLVKMDSQQIKSPHKSALQCLQVSFLPSLRHHLLLLFAREIVVVDLQYRNCVTSVSTEHVGSDFHQLFTCRQACGFYCLHVNGIVSFFQGKLEIKANGQDRAEGQRLTANGSPYFSLRQVCRSDPVRISSKALLYGACLSPSNETEVCMLQSNGHLYLWKLATQAKQEDTSLLTLDPILSDVIPPLNLNSDFKGNPLLRFRLSSFASGSSPVVTCIRACPPLTHRNWPYYRPLVAMGSKSGMIHVADLSASQHQRSFAVHTVEVKGIEWLSLSTIVSFGNSASFESDQSRGEGALSEVYVTDVESGQSCAIDTRKLSSFPVSFVKISHLRQYMIISFKDKGMQVWDAKNLTMLREIIRESNSITALEWAPFNAHKQAASQATNTSDVTFATECPKSTLNNTIAISEEDRVKEHLVFTDKTGTMYHCIAEGGSFRQGSNIPFSMGGAGKGGGGSLIVNAICWKSDVVFMGRSDGFLTVWDLNAKLSRSLVSNHSLVRKAKFGPGKGNMKVVVLFTNTIEVWDSVDLQCVSRPLQREGCKIADFDWCASDKLLLLLADQAGVYVTEMTSSKLQQPNPVLIKCEDVMTSSSPSPAPLLPRCWQSKMAMHLKFKLLDGDFDSIDNVDDVSVPILEKLKKVDTLRRCQIVSRLLGDESDILFWTAVSKSVKQCADKSSGCYDDISMDVFCDQELYKRCESARINFHHRHIENAQHTQRSIQNFIFLDELKTAIDLLLDTCPSSVHFHENSLKAALLASLDRHAVAPHSTLKLIATNLIASGKVKEGSEMLCLIDKPADACMYLRDNLLWDEAVWLAKVRLDQSAISKVLEPWAKHLMAPKVNKKAFAVALLLSMGNFKSVITILHQMRHYDRAALLASICKENNIDVLTQEEYQIYQADYRHFVESFSA